jgi:hypothetical protein
MATPSEHVRVSDNIDFLRLAATRIRLPGASILGNRLVPDEGFSLEEDKENGVILLKSKDGGSRLMLACTCAIEGGGCVPVILDPGDVDESAICLSDGTCDEYGYLCFMEINFGGGLKIQVRM